MIDESQSACRLTDEPKKEPEIELPPRSEEKATLRAGSGGVWERKWVGRDRQRGLVSARYEGSLIHKN
jgi:hypothetical protein